MPPRNDGNEQFNLENVQWRPLVRAAPFVLLVLLALYVVWKGFYTLEPHERAVVLRFGAYHETSETGGLHFMIPLVDKAVRVNVAEQSLRLPLAKEADERTPRDPRAAATQPDEPLELTGDLNAAVVEWTIQWQVTDPKKFLFSIDQEHLGATLDVVAKSVMARLVGDYSMDEILTAKREEVGLAALKATQKELDSYETGVLINDLQMQRVTPPDRVKPSFDEVNAAIQMKDRLVNEANRERNQLLPKSRAAADKLVREAEGYADRRRAEAKGEIAALLAKYRAYQVAPDITRRRLYLEAMEEVLSASGSKTILDDGLRNLLPVLPLQGDGIPGTSTRPKELK